MSLREASYRRPNPSLFEELLFTGSESIYNHPLGLTHRIQRLVLARNVAAIHSLLQDTLQLTGKASIGVAKIAEFNFDDFEKRAWVDEWRGSFFRQLWTLREELEFQGYKLQQNFRVIKMIANIVTMQGIDEEFWSRYPDVRVLQDLSEPDLMGGHGTPRDLIRLVEEQDRDDHSEWESLEELRLYAFKIMERTTDSYLQTVQATGAQFANKQSKRLITLSSNDSITSS